MTTIRDVKPCPFCGSSDVDTIGAAFVVCHGCDAFGPSVSDEQSADPVEAWNRRADTNARPVGLWVGRMKVEPEWFEHSHGVMIVGPGAGGPVKSFHKASVSLDSDEATLVFTTRNGTVCRIDLTDAGLLVRVDACRVSQ